MGGNVCLGSARAFRAEESSRTEAGFAANARVSVEGDEAWLAIDLPADLRCAEAGYIATENPGMPCITEEPNKNPDGTPSRWIPT